MCDSVGRDYIERNASLAFNCSVTCERIYADVQWVDEVKEDMIEWSSRKLNLMEKLGWSLKR